MKSVKYNPTARILHWVSAVVIIWATLSGFFIALLPPEAVLRAWLSWFNISLTTLYLPVFLFRALYAICTKKPRFLKMPAWQEVAAQTVHLLLYAVTALVLTSGILMMQDAINVFDIARLPNPLTHLHWTSFFYRLHRFGCVALFLLLLLHIGAVIRHHRAGRRVLARMT